MSLVVSARSTAGPAGIMRRWLSSSPASSAASSASSSVEQHVFPAGFRAAGVRCGVKKKQGVLDFAAIASTSPCSAAAVFTTNKFKAGPVIASQRLLQQHSGNVHGVVINSGCANACTGTKGVADAEHMIALAARAGIPNALVMSTGVIGPFLPMDKIEAGLTASSRELSGSLEAWQNASRAIMTTDTVPKLLSGTFQLPNGKSYTIAGICKGAGMIHPNMATMLAVVCTDVAISPECLQVAVRYAADRSFNSISVDGDMSTNDSMAVLANGQANGHTKADAITSVDSPAFASFQTSLTHFSQKLAQKLVRDGEGATKFVAVQVRGGRSYAECKQVAQSIATSALVKTAMYGQDANWGRIVCAVGYSGVDVDPERVNLWFVDTQRDDATHNLHLLKNGQPFDVNEEKATALVRRNDIHVRIDLGLGKEEATVWTCDFSIDYVKINADYRS